MARWVVKIKDRKLYRRFIRSISGLIARQILKKERGAGRGIGGAPVSRQPVSQGSGRRTDPGGFWISRPFTRIASWGRDYRSLTKYMLKNLTQAQRYSTQVLGFDVPVSFLDTA